LRRRGIKEIVVQVDSQRQGEAIRAVGATEVVFPERDSANAIAERFLGVFAFKRQSISRDASMIELAVPKQAEGRSLKELELRRRYNVTVVAIKTPAPEEGLADSVTVTPDADSGLVLGQVLIVVGHNNHLAKFRDEFPNEG
jgi:trk system potassium uptake protein TrkA